jgi:hypothetical protein
MSAALRKSALSPAASQPVSQDAALKSLAQEMQIPGEEVMRIYRVEVAKLEAKARIRTYVPALALHKVRARLHKHHGPRSTP